MFRTISNALRALRLASVILAITAMLCVSAASVSSAHTHLKEPVDRCGVCITAHQAAQQVVVVHMIHALELHGLLARTFAIRHVESDGVFDLLTRGPPSAHLRDA